jgi:23S rRNA (uracil1939-C5)-methyltransferase
MPSALRPDSEVELVIEKPVAGGRMLARHEGQVIFVAGAIPGERVRARVERVSKHVGFATALAVLERSPDRRTGAVDWACGGSLYAHIEYERQLALKSQVVADSFARIAKIQLPAQVAVMPSDEQGYRMRARLHAAGGAFGFYREGTHELCPAAPTRQLLPETVAAIGRLQDALKTAGVSGVVSCDVSENIEAGERAVLLQVEGSGHVPSLEPVEGVTGLGWADHQSSRLTIAYGSPYVTDRIDVAGNPAVLTRHVQSFFQSNRYLLPSLVARVLAHVSDGRVIDLYAGVGLFAVALAARGVSDIVAVEGDRSSARDLESNADPYRASIRVEHTSVEDYLARRGLEQPATLVLDPPRTGVSPEAMSGILGLRIPRIVYVSCDPATLARDVKRFVEAAYALDHIESFDLFPNTPHIETLVVLNRT